MRVLVSKILQNGFKNLLNRKGTLTVNDMEGEVNYQTCRFILENFRDEVESVSDINHISSVVQINVVKFGPTIQEFLEVASQMFPQYWKKDKDHIFVDLICANLSWSGMWDYLVSYFLKSHGERIDDSDSNALIFYSSNHKRFENNTLVDQSKVERNVNITFFDGYDKILVSIEPTLSAKKGYLISNQNRTLIFKGEDPDYRFTVSLDYFDEVESFILELIGRNLKLEYF